MKKLISICVFVGCLCAVAAFASTPTVIQKAAKNCTATTTCATASLTTTTGHANLVGCGSSSTTSTLSASDGGTNSYVAVGTANTTQTSEGSMRWFVAKNITGVAHTVSCTSTNSGTVEIFFYETSGADTVTPVDVPSTTSGAPGTSATPSFTLPATTFAHDLLLFASTCGASCSADVAADAGNSQSDGAGDESETYSKSATGTYTGQFSQTSSTYIVVGVAITDRVAGGGSASAASKSNRYSRLGVR